MLINVPFCLRNLSQNPIPWLWVLPLSTAHRKLLIGDSLVTVWTELFLWQKHIKAFFLEILLGIKPEQASQTWVFSSCALNKSQFHVKPTCKRNVSRQSSTKYACRSNNVALGSASRSSFVVSVSALPTSGPALPVWWCGILLPVPPTQHKDHWSADRRVTLAGTARVELGRR